MPDNYTIVHRSVSTGVMAPVIALLTSSHDEIVVLSAKTLQNILEQNDFHNGRNRILEMGALAALARAAEVVQVLLLFDYYDDD